MTVDETGVDEMTVDKTGVDELGINQFIIYLQQRYFVSLQIFHSQAKQGEKVAGTKYSWHTMHMAYKKLMNPKKLGPFHFFF